MASRKKPSEPVGPPQVPPPEGSRLIEQAIKRGEQLLGARPLEKEPYASWQLFATNCLEKAFGTNSANVKNVMDVSKFEGLHYDRPESAQEAERVEFLTAQLSRMRTLVDLLSVSTPGTLAKAASSAPQGQKIFLVHGHNERFLQDCARFLEKLDQEVVVLREQPSKGRTIIEKFEQQAKDVGFAVVLLTGDDQGGPLTAPEELHSRARQNVIFELGYFIGRLGRSRVCALYESGVELPSDYSGVIYEELDVRGTWKVQLARELREAGLLVDMNKL